MAQHALELFTPETVSLDGDIRLVGVDGEPGWLDGGYGKARFGEGRAFRVRPEAVEGSLVWQPRFTWSLMGTVVALAQQGQQHPVDLSEAFFTWKPLLGDRGKIAVRAGLFWPPVSLEHEGGDWHVADTITPSAINSWIGEEVKVVGLEATVVRPLAGGKLALTGALMEFNSTAGTLLAFRGWALHDEKATAFGLQPLPPLDAFWRANQFAATSPVLNADNRVGWYAKAAWSPAQAISVEYVHYDNRGDPNVRLASLQWGWRTRFDDIGAVIALGPVTLKAQGMQGSTQMGYYQPSGISPVDTRFRSAFLLASAPLGRQTLSARIDGFDTTGRGLFFGARNSETGWALTGAIKRRIGAHVTALAELLHVDSIREARRDLGLDAHQAQNQAQAALRVHF